MDGMKSLVRSVRFLRKNWRVIAIAIFSLSVAMTLAVICLSVSNTAVLVAPAGVSPNRLVAIYQRAPGKAFGHMSYPDYGYFRDNSHAFSGVAALAEMISAGRQTYGAADQVHKPMAVFAYGTVSRNYFSVLGLRPFLGSFFAAEKGKSQTPVAVMTYSCWRRLGSDPHIIGTLVGSDTVIGVAPKSFTGSLFGVNGDLLVPLSGADISNDRGQRHLYLLARLKPGASREQARADLAVLSRQLEAAYPKEEKDRTAVLTRATLLPPEAIPAAEEMVAVLLALVLLVLLIACANVANLLLALAVGRRQEATIKLALGAPRSRLIREFLREGAILCAASAAMGYALAVFVVHRYSSFSVGVPMLGGTYTLGLKLHFGVAVAAATLGLTFLAILATGLPGALYASSRQLAQVLSGEIVIGGTRKAIRRNALVIVQVAVCTLVLVGMGLCERSLYNLRHVNPGFSARNIVAEEMPIGEEGYTEAQGKQLYTKVSRAVRALPGVESAALGSFPLFDKTSVPVRLPGAAKPIAIDSGVAGVGYFRTLGIPLLEGRTFQASDAGLGPEAIVVNRKMAEKLWPGQTAVGRSLLTGNPPQPAVVVGVVGNGKYDGLDESPQPYFYYALSQHYHAQLSVIARTRGDPRLWVQPLAHAVERTGLGNPFGPMTLQGMENLTLLPERIVAGGMAVLGALGLVLAIAGLFGAISYSVSERKRELGIRVALGAQPWHLLRMIFRQTLLVAGAGTAMGIGLGVAATILLRSEFYGIGAVEWSVLVPVAAIMLAVSLGVAYVSARPWIKVNPLDAVRHA